MLKNAQQTSSLFYALKAVSAISRSIWRKIHIIISFLHSRLCNSDLSIQNDCNSAPLLAHNLYQNSSAIPSSSQSLLHNHPYRHLVTTTQQQQSAPSLLIGGLNLSSASSVSLATTPPTIVSSASAPTTSITTLSNNLYNNNHLYQHHNSTTLSGSAQNTKQNSSTASNSSSGASLALSHHQPTPLEGLSALSNVGSSSLHLSNSLCGGSSNSIGVSELGMSHWLTDGGSNSGMIDANKTLNELNANVSPLSLSTVKAEIKSPAAIIESNNLPLAPSHLDSALFCTNAINLDATQSSNAYDHKQDYYNYYNR